MIIPINKAPYSRQNNKQAFPERYKCTCCGKVFSKQIGHFFASQSPLYAGNNNYLPICRECLTTIYDEYCKTMDEKQAVKRICQKFDIYFSGDIYQATEKSDIKGSRISAYVKNSNLRQYAGKTYDNTIVDEQSIISSQDDLSDASENGEQISRLAIKRWGLGYSPEEYKFAEDLYKTFKTGNPNADGVQETYIKDLVTTKVLQNRAFKDNNADDYSKYTKLYQDTFKNSKLKINSGDGNNLNDENVCWGNWVKDVENYTPAELYQDKKLFDDVDGIKEYFKRFIVRPFKNFFTGSSEMDSEYSILPGDEDE